jgi:hypothetical protein
MVFGFGASAGFAGRWRLATGGEELGGYEIGEDAEGIVRLGGEDGRPVSGFDLDLSGVSAIELAINW